MGERRYQTLFPGVSMAQLFSTLQSLGIDSQTNIYQEIGHRNGMKGLFCKNLFLKDRRGDFYYIICFEDWKVDLKLLRKKLAAHRNFSFATPSDIDYFLGLEPGNVSPFGLLNPNSKNIRLVIDQRLAKSTQQLNFHPLVSELTTLLSFNSLKTFASFCEKRIEMINID